mgnify:CR=1 FL=1|jgi:hypothetical protein
MSDASIKPVTAPLNLFIISESHHMCKVEATYQKSFDKNLKIGSVILTFGLESSHSGIESGSKKASKHSSILASMDRDRNEVSQSVLRVCSHSEGIADLANVLPANLL